MEIVGVGFIIGCILGMAIYLIGGAMLDEKFDQGYWAGRSAGWRAYLDHQEKIRKMKARAVFDYDKH